MRGIRAVKRKTIMMYAQHPHGECIGPLLIVITAYMSISAKDTMR